MTALIIFITTVSWPTKFMFTVMPMKHTGRLTQRDRGTGHVYRCVCVHLSTLVCDMSLSCHSQQPLTFPEHLPFCMWLSQRHGGWLWGGQCKSMCDETAKSRERETERRQLEHSDNVRPTGTSYPQSHAVSLLWFEYKRQDESKHSMRKHLAKESH